MCWKEDWQLICIKTPDSKDSQNEHSAFARERATGFGCSSAVCLLLLLLSIKLASVSILRTSSIIQCGPKEKKKHNEISTILLLFSLDSFSRTSPFQLQKRPWRRQMCVTNLSPFPGFSNGIVFQKSPAVLHPRQCFEARADEALRLLIPGWKSESVHVPRVCLSSWQTVVHAGKLNISPSSSAFLIITQPWEVHFPSSWRAAVMRREMLLFPNLACLQESYKIRDDRDRRSHFLWVKHVHRGQNLSTFRVAFCPRCKFWQSRGKGECIFMSTRRKEGLFKKFKILITPWGKNPYFPFSFTLPLNY